MVWTVFFLMQASACSGCRSAASSCASIGSLSLQMKLIRTYGLWQTFCIFQPLLAFVKSEKCGRKTTCLCLWWRKTDGIDIRAVLFFHHQYSNSIFHNCKNMCETPIRYPRSHLYLMDSNLQVLAIESASLHFCNL